MLGNLIEKSPLSPEHYFYDTSENEEMLPVKKAKTTGSSSSQGSDDDKDILNEEKA
jgi:hypothetical protein